MSPGPDSVSVVPDSIIATPLPLVEVRRSARRRSTVSAYRDGGRTVVLLPDRMSPAEERRWVDRMLHRLAERERRSLAAGRASDDDLAERARYLVDRFIPEAGEPAVVRWVQNQRSRWASCTPADRSIRVSGRVRPMPGWVLDYVLMHELAHFVVPGHDARFWQLVERYPRCERARGYLEGAAAQG